MPECVEINVKSQQIIPLTKPSNNLVAASAFKFYRFLRYRSWRTFSSSRFFLLVCWVLSCLEKEFDVMFSSFTSNRSKVRIYRPSSIICVSLMSFFGARLLSKGATFLFLLALSWLTSVAGTPVPQFESSESFLASSKDSGTQTQSISTSSVPLQRDENAETKIEKNVYGMVHLAAEESTSSNYGTNIPSSISLTSVSEQNIKHTPIYTPLSSRLNLGFIVGLMCIVVSLMVVVEQVDIEDEGSTGRTCQFLYLPSKYKRWHGKAEDAEIIAPLMQWINWRFSLLKICHTGDIIIIFLPVLRQRFHTNIDSWIFPINHIVLVSWYIVGVILLRRLGKELSITTRTNAKYGLVCSLFAESLMLLYLFYYGKDFPWGR